MVNGLVIKITTMSSFQERFQALSISFLISRQNHHQFAFAGEDKEQLDHLETHTQGENMEKGDNIHTISSCIMHMKEHVLCVCIIALDRRC